MLKIWILGERVTCRHGFRTANINVRQSDASSVRCCSSNNPRINWQVLTELKQAALVSCCQSVRDRSQSCRSSVTCRSALANNNLQGFSYGFSGTSGVTSRHLHGAIVMCAHFNLCLTPVIILLSAIFNKLLLYLALPKTRKVIALA